MNRALIIAGFSVLSTVAVAGWMRKPAQPALPVQNAAYAAPLQGGSPYAPAGYSAGVPYGLAAPVRATNAVYETQPVLAGRVATQRAVTRPASRPQAAVRTVRRKRPLTHSVAIVAGSAGAGAAIGGLAGGGKGGGIGAIAGGAAGLLYDRLTATR